MSKAVLLSIQPKWCEKIARGEKTVEVRKTRPAVYQPFKCYIYCTYGKGLIERYDPIYPNMLLDQTVNRDKTLGNCCNGKVIGEFVCMSHSIEEYHADEMPFGEYDIDEDIVAATGMTKEELWSYGQGATLYGWHISNLKIYKEPKELCEFFHPCIKKKYPYCLDCEHGLRDGEKPVLPGLRWCDVPCDNWLKRPPQSWCYVEEVQGDAKTD